ncbi:DRC1 [Symbiodinium pilosum]|uniref:DRC1 protein n=1 Tax=Symbiodinium pilosum TaxID=2952 RepID=A0A812LZT3_SYMPI|nr:DRC1 [Symbiodinium pilosum]
MSSSMNTLEISNLGSSDERIAARRQRAEAKLKQDKEEAEGKKTKKDDAAEQVSLGKEQYGKSVAELERFRTETWEELTSIRVRFDDQENQRRIVEENNRLDRYEALQIEAVTSGRKNAAIEMKWADLLNMDIPQELNDQLQFQKSACRQIIESKDRRIEDFKTELKNKDEEYIKMLKQQSLDITTLITKMREQYHALRQHYEKELEDIEQAFEDERKEMLQKNKAEIEVALFEKRRQMEENEFLERRQERERGFQQQIEELRTDNADGYNKCKIALEKGIQELEQHLEKMLATYLLNKEKLEYNLQAALQGGIGPFSWVPLAFKPTNSSLADWLPLLSDILRNALISRYNTLDQKYKTHNHELTEEYKRLTKQFKDLQEKFQHFEQADEKKFREVWEMNEAEVRGLMTKVLEADRLLHEQQLGHEWVPPKEELLQQELDTFSESGTTTGKSTALESAEMGQSDSGKFSATKVKKVLDLIKEETQFLLDLKVRDQLAELPPEQRDVLQIDALLRYIGVEGQQDVDLLVQVFYRGQEEDDEALMVEPDDVLQLLKDFIEEKENMRIADVAPDKKKKARTQQLGSESEADRKARRRREERKFWERMGHVIPDMNFRVWKALDVFLKRYYDLLQKRSKAIDSAVWALKQMWYLGSKVNEELQVPPGTKG